MANDDKRLVRRIKRDLKREGNKNRRRALKRSLEVNPDEAQFDNYEFKRDSSKPWNGLTRDRSRVRSEEEE
jgi:hypothetical protein